MRRFLYFGIALVTPLGWVGWAACGDGPDGPGGASVAIQVAPLDLPSTSDVCYNVWVTNGSAGTGDVVWRQNMVCATTYGDNVGAISYVGTCDATNAGTTGRINSVTVALVDMWADGDDHVSAGASYVDHGEYQNPCGTSDFVPTYGSGTGPWNSDGFAACRRDFPCFENRDTQAVFDITVLRNANQGFFDVAVNFEDVFCSAKFDCAYERRPDGTACGSGGCPIELLFAADGVRHETAILALACTAGAAGPGSSSATHLYMSDVVIVCDGAVVATLDPAVDRAGRLGPGNQMDPAGTVNDTNSAILYQWAVYRGRETLGVDAQPPFVKAYWNVAIGFDVSDMAGRQCHLTTRATASGGPLEDPRGGMTPPDSVYPEVLFDVDLNGGLGRLTCGSNALDATSTGPVRTRYVSGAADCLDYHGYIPTSGEMTTERSACVAQAPVDPSCAANTKTFEGTLIPNGDFETSDVGPGLYGQGTATFADWTLDYTGLGGVWRMANFGSPTYTYSGCDTLFVRSDGYGHAGTYASATSSAFQAKNYLKFYARTFSHSGSPTASAGVEIIDAVTNQVLATPYPFNRLQATTAFGLVYQRYEIDTSAWVGQNIRVRFYGGVIIDVYGSGLFVDLVHTSDNPG